VLLGIDLEAFTVGCGVDPRLLGGVHLYRYLDPDDQKPADATAPSGRREAVFLTLRSQPFEMYRSFTFDPANGDLIYTATDPVSRTFNARRPLHLKDPTTHNAEYKLRMADFTAFHARRNRYFVRTVQACLERGANVTAFLTTAHPALQQFLNEQTTFAQRLADFRQGLSANRATSFRFLDCSTPATFGGSDDDFINPAHIGGYNADLLLRHLLAA
jgi:hypothetical protein